MKKKLAFLLAAALLLTSCAFSDTATQTDTTAATSYTESAFIEAYPTLKWGSMMDQSDEAVNAINKKLHEDGYQFNVEFIELEYLRMDFSDEENPVPIIIDPGQSVHEYEKENGLLDIVSLWGVMYYGGASYDFIESGYFEPLDYKNTVAYDFVPKEYWKSITVNGEIYTIPLYGYVSNFSQLSFNLNSDYVSEEDIENFDGTMEGVEAIALKIPQEKRLQRLSYSVKYAGFCSTEEFDEQVGLLLLYDTMRAANPYEYEPFIEWARTINRIYNEGLFDFEDIDFVIEGGNTETSKSAIIVTAWHYTPEGDFVEFTGNSGYLESSTSNSVGISAASEHKEEALQLLNLLSSDETYKDLFEWPGFFIPAGTATSEEKIAELENTELKVSPFCGYQIYYKDVEEYSEVRQACYDFYTQLCKAEDFDSKLAEINAELKEMGIDDFVARVNELLEEHGF